MKKLALLFGSALLFAGCAGGNHLGADGPVPDANDQSAASAAETPADAATVTPSAEQGPAAETGGTLQPKPWSQPATTTQSATQPKYPVATPVAGKPGIVRSPYAPYAGDVDVREFSSGQQVRCPYTGKIFIVP
jgi:hypothetical protein